MTKYFLMLAGLTYSSQAFSGIGQSAQAPSGISVVINMIVCLIFVLGCVYAFAKLLKKIPMAGFTNGSHINVIDSKKINQTDSVSIVEVDGKWFVLASSSGAINHIHTMAPQEKEVSNNANGMPFQEAFAEVLKNKFKKKV